ncbi:hypothetical protein SAMN06295924_10892 [Rathayibacter rathayi NCPPB 2980 = VKM Ac-1601]|nr:hypothetical protein SAMN06295924_10892 [Rathayibacter rathayi NCPPB 2980 = VKM Ac-1601]
MSSEDEGRVLPVVACAVTEEPHSPQRIAPGARVEPHVLQITENALPLSIVPSPSVGTSEPPEPDTNRPTVVPAFSS